PRAEPFGGIDLGLRTLRLRKPALRLLGLGQRVGRGPRRARYTLCGPDSADPLSARNDPPLHRQRPRQQRRPGGPGRPMLSRAALLTLALAACGGAAGNGTGPGTAGNGAGPANAAQPAAAPSP